MKFNTHLLARGLLLLSISSFAAARVSKLSGSCCCKLSAALGDEVFYPPRNGSIVQTAGEYAALNTERWSNTAILSPSCVFRPSCAESLSKGIKILTRGSCKFAVKAGGHMAVPGANDIDNGVSIDLQFLNQTVLSEDKSSVSLGSGVRWLDAYNAMEGQGVGFPGGLCGTTGVGGVTLGGGQSIFFAEKGWSVDSVINFEVVLACGKIVNANSTHNCNLFKALKGGSSNFGIVTRVDLKTFPYDNMLWGGQIVVPAVEPLVDLALSATTTYTTMNNDFLPSALQTVFFYLSDGTQVIDFALASTNNTVNPPIFAPITSLQPQLGNTVHSRSLPDLIEEIIPTQPAGYRQLWSTVSFVNDLDTILGIHNITNELYAQAKASVPNMDWIIFYQPQPKVVETYGTSLLNLEHVDHDQMLVYIAPRWTDAQYDDTMYALAQKWSEAVTEYTKEKGTDDPFLYLNFAAQFQDPICAYGKDNVAFMHEVAAQYDPTGVFQTLVPGGFKLSKACGGGCKKKSKGSKI